MTKRAFLAAVLGGMAMFFWSFVAHMVLPLGAVGVQEIPNEQSLLSGLHSTLSESPGLYMFPAMGPKPDMEAYTQKLAVNPSGLLVYHPPGAKSLTPGQLGTEFLIEMIEALLAVFLLAQTGLKTFGSRAGFVTAAGLLAVLPTNVSYWNWYGFPTSYTVSYMSIQLVGFVVAGITAGAMLRGRALQG